MMTFIQHSSPSAAEPLLSRQRYLSLVQAGLAAGHFRFAREAVLDWLASYPGDLEAGLYYAQALAGEKRFPQAVVVLDGLCRADPEFLAAVESWLAVDGELARQSGAAQDASYRGRTGLSTPRLSGTQLSTYLLALTGRESGGDIPSAWGSQLWQARQALQAGNLAQTEALVREALASDPPTALAAVVHLRYLEANPALTSETRRKFALRYSQRWPDCLAVMLYLADWSIDCGDEATGVALLHQAAARDAAGQVPARLWGWDHPYRQIWPTLLELRLRTPVPAEVAALVGWNRLADRLERSKAAPATASLADQVAPVTAKAPATPLPPELNETVVAAPQVAAPSQTDQPANAFPKAAEDAVAALQGEAPLPEETDEQAVEQLQPEAEQPSDAYTEELRLIKDDLERLAQRLNAPDLISLDGRQPVYVLFSVRSRLQAVYGEAGAAQIELEMQNLGRAVQAQLRWDYRLFFPDDPRDLAGLGMRLARPGDPWSLKLALADLDAALARRGQMIGAVLIVGGPDIVPFHRLPNPVDDPDAEVLSDNPYSTRDENYFVPEWPVGRLPGGVGSDPTLLLKVLRRIVAHHAVPQQGGPWYRRWLTGVSGWLKQRRLGRLPSFGYSAAIWKRAAAAVYQAIGDPEKLLLSPPLGLNSLPPAERKRLRLRKAVNSVPAPSGCLAYFNLHGVEDRAEWFGHRDPFTGDDGPDYPVALRPEDISLTEQAGNQVPQIVFSEACYGLHIADRTAAQAVCLRFLEAGSLAVIGSTGMAYGSIDAPLIAADFLGKAFWRHLLEGLPAGEALRQAKIALAGEMSRRQGYLDGEDQKTLISFVLYGDPLARPEGKAAPFRSVRRAVQPREEVKVVCDRSEGEPLPASPEVVARVKQVVAQYLPGMEDAEILVARERSVCLGKGHRCPASQLSRSPTASLAQPREAGRQLVTLSKQVVLDNGRHPQVARLTLDEGGQLIKLVVSR